MAFVVPASAQAAFVTINGSPYSTSRSVQYFAGGGETNNVTVTGDRNQITITDSGAIISSPNNGVGACTISGDGHTATCPAGTGNTFQFFSASLGDGNDVLTNNLATLVPEGIDPSNYGQTSQIFGGDGDDDISGSDTDRDFINGQAGNDTLRGRGGNDFLSDSAGFDDDTDTELPSGNDQLFGGSGDDSLNAGNGDDGLSGDAGNDSLFGDKGNDTLNGGDGFDDIGYADPEVKDAEGNFVAPKADTPGIIVKLDAGAATTGNGLPGENDTVVNVEDVFGTSAADQITGSAAGNIIMTFGGNDAIIGGGGSDNIDAGGDKDTIDAQDSTTDRVTCGGQADDTAKVDNIDQTSGCPAPGSPGLTVVNVPPPAGPVVIPTDRDAPVIKALSASRSPSARALRRNGRYRFTITTGDPASVTNTVIGTLTAQVKNVTISTAGEAQFAQRRRSFKSKVTVTMTIPKKMRRALRKGKKMRLLIQLSDPSDNTTTRRINLRLKA